jgi:DNA-binding PadR family transcriptional regulator
MLPKPLVTASLRPVILTLLHEWPGYGYEFNQCVHALTRGQIQLTPGKRSPLLHGLEIKGLIEAFRGPSEAGADRTYYRVTARGQVALARAKQSWPDLNTILVRLWGPDLQLQPGR